MARVIGEGLCDHAPVYAAVEAYSPGARVLIPPRQDAAVRPTAAPSPTHRDRHLVAMESDGRCAWKRPSGYDAQRHAEQALSRCQRIFDEGVRATGNTGGGAGAGSVADVRVAESVAGAGAFAVLSGRLQVPLKGPALLSVDACNKPVKLL
jgi:hypothetical protein